MSNTFEEAAFILRGIKERMDQAQQERTQSGSVNVFRSATSKTLGADTTTTATGDAAGFTWGDSQWDYTEWGE